MRIMEKIREYPEVDTPADNPTLEFFDLKFENAAFVVDHHVGTPSLEAMCALWCATHSSVHIMDSRDPSSAPPARRPIEVTFGNTISGPDDTPTENSSRSVAGSGFFQSRTAMETALRYSRLLPVTPPINSSASSRREELDVDILADRIRSSQFFLTEEFFFI